MAEHKKDDPSTETSSSKKEEKSASIIVDDDDFEEFKAKDVAFKEHEESDGGEQVSRVFWPAMIYFFRRDQLGDDLLISPRFLDQST